MNLIPLPAFADNYLWLLHDGQHALVVDPGDAQPVLDALQRLGLQLQTILVTHHHADHIGGVPALRSATGAQVFGPAFEAMPEPITRCSGGEHVAALGLDFMVIDVPGHTAGHIAYFCQHAPSGPLLFCGDTLFSGGCGRLFEGSPAQMLASLNTLAALPTHTRVCCTHEYTLANLKFALAVEPGNQDLQHYQQWCLAQRKGGLPTLPSTMAQELLINPFLRTDSAEVQASVHRHLPSASSLAEGAAITDALSVFTALREWKNNFR